MDAQLRARYMQAMGIPVWLPKNPASALCLSEERTVTVSTAPELFPPLQQELTVRKCAGLSWSELAQTVQSCTRCALANTRTQTVFGTGNPQAAWMIIGEAPGAEEDRQGIPFVGKAGQLLNQMLEAIGMSREAVYIANVLKCRPPNNRDPKPDEVANCHDYLERQIALVNPKLILVVGRIAAQNLLQTDVPLARLRGQAHRAPLSHTPVIVTYHPAYLLRQPVDKRKAWQDLLFAREVFNRVQY